MPTQKPHSFSVTCTEYPIWNAKYWKPCWLGGYLSWLFSLGNMACTNSGLFRKRSVIIKNLGKKEEESLVTRNKVKETWHALIYFISTAYTQKHFFSVNFWFAVILNVLKGSHTINLLAAKRKKKNPKNIFLQFYFQKLYWNNLNWFNRKTRATIAFI